MSEYKNGEINFVPHLQIVMGKLTRLLFVIFVSGLCLPKIHQTRDTRTVRTCLQVDLYPRRELFIMICLLIVLFDKQRT